MHERVHGEPGDYQHGQRKPHMRKGDKQYACDDAGESAGPVEESPADKRNRTGEKQEHEKQEERQNARALLCRVTLRCLYPVDEISQTLLPCEETIGIAASGE